MEKLMPFIMHHLWLVAAFILVLVLLFVEEARSQNGSSVGKRLSSSDAVNQINRNKGVFVDVRDEQAFSQAHIKGSVHIPVDQLEAQSKRIKKHKNAPIVVVCQKGRRAVAAAATLRTLGYQQVFVLLGGIEGWQADEMPLSQT